MKHHTLDHCAAVDRRAAFQIAEREAGRQIARQEAHRRAVVGGLLCEARRLMVVAHLLRAAERREWLRSLSSQPPEPAPTPGIHYHR